MEKISWTDHVRNEEVLLRVNEQRNILHEIRKRKANYFNKTNTCKQFPMYCFFFLELCELDTNLCICRNISLFQTRKNVLSPVPVAAPSKA